MFKEIFKRNLWASVLMIMVSWAVLLPGAHAWWNEQWKYRKKVAFDTTIKGADIQQNISQFPVLIRLHSGNFDFAKAKENGEDLRFVSGDDTVLLKYHIERFDSLDEIALIWVKVPDISGKSDQGSVWLYYGNETAANGADKKNSFDSQYQAVYHFDELEGMPQDASSFLNHPSEFTAGLGLAGIIGNGAAFSGPGNVFSIPDNSVFNFSQGMTFSTWIKIYQPQDDAYLFSRTTGDNGVIIAIRGTKIDVQIKTGDTLYKTDQSTDLPLDGWHHLAVTLAPKGRITLFLDGIEAQWVNTQADLSTIAGNVMIGSDAAGKHAFSGDLDELRISGIPRSPAWIRSDCLSQGREAALCAYSLEEISESSSGMPVFYLATIFKNITLDGLVVIVLLVILSGLSWVVMITKAVLLWNTARGNRRFLAQYHKMTDPVVLAIESEKYNGSGCFRIFEAGCNSLDLKDLNTCEEIDGQVRKPVFSSRIIDNLKAILEKGLIEETKRLNSWLVVLTMAISGGPFLGLLGTVWGVMNTFAAMAEAGEANIMAIAPGVASALSTTVFGLIVAIPALFGYNFISGIIRDITADSGMFVDQFALKVDAVYGGDK
ncbi:MAG: DUF2341 domain-containing protein [Pseudomonadota bacterium]